MLCMYVCVCVCVCVCVYVCVCVCILSEVQERYVRNQKVDSSLSCFSQFLNKLLIRLSFLAHCQLLT